ncbi:hypothetical protein NM688_g1708 [Phlebia brevispora]|uniref:Uncharacterized protein n=1 Tax=Phlebia brevispora TaxID=194682 RepID=A0ACC1TAR7_9APHY|nr:hypothetical protein NM688_g1708 [Phlebia brevispora]
MLQRIMCRVVSVEALGPFEPRRRSQEEGSFLIDAALRDAFSSAPLKAIPCRARASMSRSRAPDPPYPSFSLVMTTMDRYYPFRLPAYRSSYMNRYHPYPRVKRPLDLMQTVDRRHVGLDEIEAGVEELLLHELSFSQPSTDEYENETAVLQAALATTGSGDGEHEPDSYARKRVSFSSLVVDLAVRIGRGCRRVLPAKPLRSSTDAVSFK